MCITKERMREQQIFLQNLRISCARQQQYYVDVYIGTTCTAERYSCHSLQRYSIDKYTWKMNFQCRKHSSSRSRSYAGVEILILIMHMIDRDIMRMHKYEVACGIFEMNSQLQSCMWGRKLDSAFISSMRDKRKGDMRKRLIIRGMSCCNCGSMWQY